MNCRHAEHARTIRQVWQVQLAATPTQMQVGLSTGVQTRSAELQNCSTRNDHSTILVSWPCSKVDLAGMNTCLLRRPKRMNTQRSGHQTWKFRPPTCRAHQTPTSPHRAALLGSSQPDPAGPPSDCKCAIFIGFYNANWPPGTKNLGFP